MTTDLKKKLIYAAVPAIILIGGFLTYRFIQEEKTIPEATLLGLDSDLVDDDIDFDIKAEEIKFKKTLLVHRDKYSTDGGPLKTLQCTTMKRKTIAYFYLDGGKDKAVISCTDEYMGGVTISYEDKQGEVQDLELAQNEGDAEDIWETRSLITKDDSSLQVARVTLTASSSVLLDNVPSTCDEEKNHFRWNALERKFEEVPYASSFSVKEFIRPTIEGCLREDGSLKQTK